MKRKLPPISDRGDTANVPSLEEAKESYRNQLFDFIIETGVFFYAALLVDYPNENLVCGQVGEIQNMIIDENEKSYYLIFTDFQNNERQFAYCLIKKGSFTVVLFRSSAR